MSASPIGHEGKGIPLASFQSRWRAENQSSTQ